jgi:GNAT superfamily N-acetyltransferase
MVVVREATDSEAGSWLDGWRKRLHRWYARHDVGDEWVSRQVRRRLSNHLGSPFVFVLNADGEDVGILAAARIDGAGGPTTAITDLWVVAERRRRGYGSAALRWAETWAASHSKKLIVLTDPAEPSVAGRYPLRAQSMLKRASSVDLLPAALTGQPMTDAQFGPWWAKQLREYADSMVDSGMLPAAEAAARASAQLNEFLPDGRETADNTLWCLLSGTEVVATLWLGHHNEPGASWVHKVEVSESHRGRGYGRAAMLLAERHTVAGGDTHVALNVFAHNKVAINLYDALGYHTVDEHRSTNL